MSRRRSRRINRYEAAWKALKYYVANNAGITDEMAALEKVYRIGERREGKEAGNV
jgi:hypothetical protein